MRSAPIALTRLIAAELSTAVSAEVEALAEAIQREHGDSFLGLLFYGSCLRENALEGRIADFYLLVRSYRAFHRSRLAAAANAALPPSVFYFETAHAGTTLRAKVAVLSLRDLVRGSASRSFLSYLWGRFAQPCRLLRATDSDVEKRVSGALGSAVVTLLRRGLPLMPARFSSEELWQRALAESYRTELRAERGSRSGELVAADPARYEALLRAAAEGRALPGARRRGDGGGYEHQPSWAAANRCALAWRLRRLAGKSLHVLRLVKSAFTFKDGLDYLLWKIERHSGVTLEVAPWQRRHPLLAAPGLAWRLYRKGAFC
ncbi:MAG: hypothetical protein WD489_07720 [Rhodovibrionaceae bacterium]